MHARVYVFTISQCVLCYIPALAAVQSSQCSVTYCYVTADLYSHGFLTYKPKPAALTLNIN